MKTKRTSCVLGAGVVLFLCAPIALANHVPGPLGPELVVNGDFEDRSNLGVWNGVAKGATDPACAPLDCPGNGGGFAGGGGNYLGQDWFIFQEVAVTPGSEYQLNFDLLHIDSATNTPAFAITGPIGDTGRADEAWSLIAGQEPVPFDGPLQGTGHIIRLGPLPAPDGVWRSFTLELEALKSSITLRQNGGNSSVSYVDNISLREIPEPATIGLLSLGVLGLLCRRPRMAC